VEKSRLSVWWLVLVLLLPAGVAAGQPGPDPSASPQPATQPEPPGPSTPPPAPAEGETPLKPPDTSKPETPGKEGKAGKAAKALSARYDQGLAFGTEDGAFKAKLNLRNQIRFESTRPTPGSEILNHIYIVRSRLQLEGNVFGEDNRYKLEVGLGDSGSFSFIKDLYIDKAVGPAWIRVGQWKRPFNRQEIVSDFSAQFNERANTAGYVGGGRDLGIAIHNDYEKSPEGIEWAFGVFNNFNGGSDRPVITTTCTQNATTGAIACANPAPSTFPNDWSPALVARLGWNSKGIKGYSDGDLEGGPLRYAVGVSYKVDLANFAKGKEQSKTDNMSHGLEADAAIKVEGFSLTLGGYAMKVKSNDVTYGAFAQAGMFVVPKHGEIAARFAAAPPTQTTTDRRQLEVRGAFNWYWEGHRWKWATDVGFLKLTGTDMTGATDDPDYQLRTMAQLTF
jgi:hypothetical protein